jgi:hypothetical protein
MSCPLNEFEGDAFTDACPVMGTWGQLLDIVKIEERETWPARFLRFERWSLGSVD